MPYSSTKDLPKAVRDNLRSEKDRRQFMHVFNSAFKRCQEKGGKDCESKAFAQANGVAKKG